MLGRQVARTRRRCASVWRTRDKDHRNECVDVERVEDEWSHEQRRDGFSRARKGVGVDAVDAEGPKPTDAVNAFVEASGSVHLELIGEQLRARAATDAEWTFPKNKYASL